MWDMTTPTEAPAAEAGWVADDSSFGARLALVRQRMGWSNVSEAARQCGLLPESWRLWEQGRMPSRLTTIAMAIATRAGCDYLWLVHGPDRGGAVRRTAYIDQTVVTRMGGPARPIRRGQVSPYLGRPVRQTRPVGQGSIRPATPVGL